VNVKYQVFLSSTYEDLKSERDQAGKAILEMGHIPVGMEMFSAADEEQWQIIARHIETTDYYVVIVAHRYGSMDASGVSYTEKEYDYAVAQGVPVLGFVISDSAAWPPGRMEKDEAKRRALERFKEKVQSRYVSSWTSSDDLYGRISIALTKQIQAKPRTGWVRADQVSSPEVAAELARLSKENATLRLEIASVGHQSPRPAAIDPWRSYFDAVSDLVAQSTEHHDAVHSKKISSTQISGWRGSLRSINAVLARLELEITGTPTEVFLDPARELVKKISEEPGAAQYVAEFRHDVAQAIRKSSKGAS
jgi:hypothetical protein